MNENFFYLIEISVGAKNFSILVKNKNKTPSILLEEIAKQKITDYINENYSKFKDYRTQTLDQFFNKMIKQSDFKIEDLNDLEIYDLNLKFENNKIKNELNGEAATTKQSSFNEQID